MKFLTYSPKLLMCSTVCSQIASHCISCLFPKFELSYKYIKLLKREVKGKHLYASVLGSAQCFKRIDVRSIKEVLKQCPRDMGREGG